MKTFTIDSTLLDSGHCPPARFSLEDKLLIAEELDRFGMDLIEAGRPGSDPADALFLNRAREIKLTHARLTSVGPVRIARNPAAEDRGVRALLDVATPVVTLFADAGDEDALARIADTVAFVKSHGREVIFDAERFFETFIANPQGAMRTLRAARDAGADVLLLSDIGETITSRLIEICAEVRKQFPGPVGIRAHGADIGVANTLAAVELGFTYAAGSICAHRGCCGRTNLCSVIAALGLKMRQEPVDEGQLGRLDGLARFIADLASLPVCRRERYFHPSDAEWIERRSRELGFDAAWSEAARRELLDRIQQLRHEGYDLDAADGAVELMIREAARPGIRLFDVIGFEVTTRTLRGVAGSTAAITLKMGDAAFAAEAACSGPVDALDTALRKCLAPLYPSVSTVLLSDYRVQVLEPHRGTAARVRVTIEWSSGQRKWSTMGVSANIIEASWLALVGGVRLELMRLGEQDESIFSAVEDNSWAV